MVDKKIFVFRDQYIRSFISFSQEDNYALKQCPKKEDCGLYYYNMNDLIQNLQDDQVKTLHFTFIDIGVNKHLQYSHDERRVGYFNSLSHITIIPLLHNNTNKFIGIDKPHKYMAYRV
mmetsp:Transcript_28426/g.27391  ORF Transcript_28426/g.27391 Transcript_28426/m.27391 type:complete len:118 (+) Transcript_28426:1919-2272(+)